jgi:predicted NBD/HSP70 family sugar kinase
LTGLTGATVSTTVRDLIKDGFVYEVDQVEPTAGKPRRLVRLVRDARHAVGVHLDQGSLRLVLTDMVGGVVAAYADESVGSRGPAELVGLIALYAGQLIETSGLSRQSVLGIGVCSPGPMTPDADMVLSPADWRRWSPFPFAAALKSATGMPVMVDNDATACAFGEYWTNPVGVQGLATLYMGVGVGGAVIIDGEPYRGASGNSVEVGHICVDLDGPPCWCGGRGCVEVMGGPHTIVLQAQELGLLESTDQADSVSLLGQFIRVADLARAGDPQALALFHESARYIAVGALTLAGIVDPEHIALTGLGFAAAGDLYLPAIEDILRTQYMARASHTIDVWVSPHAANAPAIGAAALMLQSELLFG